MMGGLIALAMMAK